MSLTENVAFYDGQTGWSTLENAAPAVFSGGEAYTILQALFQLDTSVTGGNLINGAINRVGQLRFAQENSRTDISAAFVDEAQPGQLPWFIFNSEIQAKTYIFNSFGELRPANLILTLAHELAHANGAMDPPGSLEIGGPTDEVLNDSSYNYDGGAVDAQNAVARDLGLTDDIRASYIGALDGREVRFAEFDLGFSYTDGAEVDVVRIGDRRGFDEANNQDHSARTDASRDLIFGLGGEDTIKGGGGNDHLYGGRDNDQIDGGDDDDRLFGEAGNDLLEGGAGNDALDGGAGNDTLTGGDGDDFLSGGDGDDVLSAGGGINGLDGGAGADILSGDADGNDFLFGGDGDDVLLVFGLDSTVGGDGGNDVIDATFLGARQFDSEGNPIYPAGNTVVSYGEGDGLDRIARFDWFDLDSLNFDNYGTFEELNYDPDGVRTIYFGFDTADVQLHWDAALTDQRNDNGGPEKLYHGNLRLTYGDGQFGIDLGDVAGIKAGSSYNFAYLPTIYFRDGYLEQGELINVDVILT